MTKPLVHSYSSLKKYRTCPKQWNHVYRLKDVPFEDSPQLRWGNECHTALENRVKSRVPLPDTMKQYEPFAATIDPHPFVKVEEKLGMGKSGGWTGFFANDVWARGKVDVAIFGTGEHPDPDWRDCESVFILDWKTGKVYEDPSELHFHAMLLKANFPQITKFKGVFAWLADMKLGNVYDLDPQAEMDKTKRTVEQIETLIARDSFPPNEGPLCGWCSVKSCEFNKSKR